MAAATYSYAIRKSGWSKHYNVHRDTPDGPVIYYGETHHFHRHQPTVTLRAGASATGTRIAAAHVRGTGEGSRLVLDSLDRDNDDVASFTKDLEKDHGDLLPSKERSLDNRTEAATAQFWDRKSFGMKHYELSSPLAWPVAPQRWCWTRTSTFGEGFECRNVATDAVVARFDSRSACAMKKLGMLQLFVEGETADLLHDLLLLSFMALREMEMLEGATIAAIAS